MWRVGAPARHQAWIWGLLYRAPEVRTTLGLSDVKHPPYEGRPGSDSDAARFCWLRFLVPGMHGMGGDLADLSRILSRAWANQLAS